MSVGADKETLDVYESAGVELADRFERHDRTILIDRIEKTYKPAAKILEIGSGSGADAEAMLNRGFDVTASDASPAMIAIALERRPLLKGRMVQALLPDRLPFLDEEFDGVVGIAILQHLPLESLLPALKEIRRVLRPTGKVFLWVFDRRSDLDSNSRDSLGRLMTLLPSQTFEPLIAQAGYTCLSNTEIEDVLARPGVVPREFVLQKPAS